MIEPPRVGILVNGGEDSAMAERARAFVRELSAQFEFQIEYRRGGKLTAAWRMFRGLQHFRPRVIYVLDMSASGVLAAFAYRLLHLSKRVVIDAGDAIYELARSSRMRGRVGLWLTWLLERFSLSIADHLVVRGSFHRERLIAHDRIEASRVTVVQDGVDPSQFTAVGDVQSLRESLGLQDSFVVGVVGSSIWSEHLQMCYGWELIELLHLLKHRPVKGVLIGDGSGIEHLRRKCEEFGIVDRMVFAGRVPYEQLPRYLALFDVALSTQTNNLAGQVRTTGKLPLYLASGRHVLASRVGEAARVLGDDMLVDYVGTKDAEYPRRLAQRIEMLLDAAAPPSPNAHAVELARRHFDYAILAPRIGAVLSALSS